ncbi:hypothetical protein SUGI_0429710 [Cryptomeria japonica]|nr:hypothetical protein SUGI_0429710 [Cryptomeria japonica]
MGQLANIMLGKIVIPKYSDPSSPVVSIVINGNQIKNVLIDLRAAINVMPREVMKHLENNGLRTTPIVLQLVDGSTVRPGGIIEDVIAILDSWEYLVDFMILSPKATLGGYPVILGRPWLSTTDAYIGCRSGDMIISDGSSTKTLALYSLAQPQFEQKQVVWPILGEESDEIDSINHLMMINLGPLMQLYDEESILYKH